MSQLRVGSLAGLGALLAMTIIVGVVHPHDLLAGKVTLLGAVPAVLLGVFLVRIGSELAEAPRWIRFLTLAPPALAVSITLGIASGVPLLAAYGLMPTLWCVHSIERQTRLRAALPVAVVRPATAP